MLKYIFLTFHQTVYKLTKLKSFYYSRLFKHCGDNLMIYGTCNIKNPQNIAVGKDVSFNDNCYLNGYCEITIGDNVSISPGAIIVPTKLDPTLLIRDSVKKHISKKIIIGNNTQIGAGAIILPGVTIGNNVIIGAGSVVTKDVQSDCILTGISAQNIRRIKSRK